MCFCSVCLLLIFYIYTISFSNTASGIVRFLALSIWNCWFQCYRFCSDTSLISFLFNWSTSIIVCYTSCICIIRDCAISELEVMVIKAVRGFFENHPSKIVNLSNWPSNFVSSFSEGSCVCGFYSVGCSGQAFLVSSKDISYYIKTDCNFEQILLRDHCWWLSKPKLVWMKKVNRNYNIFIQKVLARGCKSLPIHFLFWASKLVYLNILLGRRKPAQLVYFLICAIAVNFLVEHVQLFTYCWSVVWTCG